MQDSVVQQENRMPAAGYPKPLITAMAESLFKRLKLKHRSDCDVWDQKKKNLVVMTYVHGISHRLKKVAAKNDIRLVCSAPSKLESLCKRVFAARYAKESMRHQTCQELMHV